jgi:predicted metal-dependent phosphoesterase TrpH
LIVDFHSHTAHSDGTLSSQALADFMGERAVAVFSITDHDTFSAYGTFEPPAGARVVTGIEINTTYRGNEVHILGYGLPLDDADVATMIEHNRNARRLRIDRIVTQLRTAGYGITVEAVLQASPDAKALGRPHVAKALVLGGMVPDIEYAFRHLLRGGKPGFVPSTHITPQRAIETISASGGVAVLAHPGRLRDVGLIDELAQSGLQGLEVFYPRHDMAEVALFREKAQRYGLLMSAGADFHDIRYHPRGVGMDVPDDAIAPFIDRVA